MTPNKNRIPVLYLAIDCKYSRSAAQIMSLQDEYTLRFSNFLMNELCNSSVNSWFRTTSFLITPPQVLAPDEYLSKK